MIDDFELNIINLLNKGDSVHINLHANNWFTAVKYAMSTLIQKNHSISPLIVDQVILEVQENMNNFIIAKNVALIYSEKIEFVNKITLSLNVFKESVMFNENPIKIIIAFCFDQDNAFNISLLKQIALVFSKNDAVSYITSAQSDIEIINYIENILISANEKY